jgi:type I restriction enzyme R subunit
MSQFQFLQAEWPDVFAAAKKAEELVHPDARASCFYARRALELAVHWLYKHDSSLRLPYQDHLSALIHEPTFRQAVGPAVFTKVRVIKDLGNLAVHSHRPVRQYDALAAVRELFHFSYWLAHTYGRGAKPEPGLAFDADRVAQAPADAGRKSREQLQRLEEQLRERDEKLAALLADKSALDAELERAREAVAKAKKANAAQPDKHDYSEAQTRDYFIDLLLAEAAWPLDQPRDREFPVMGMPTAKGEGFVDYVLWGDDGIPLAIVEAKRTKKDAKIGQQQAKLYADCLEKMFGRRPVIFLSNGYEHWIWDDESYPPRPVQGFYKKDELELLIQRRTTKRSLASAPINTEIVERFYQSRCIRHIGEAFEQHAERKTLVVMATGAGKTRTVIALTDLLMRCNWVKRTLFLCDRVALVRQAVNAFKEHLPDSSPVNLVTEKGAEGRVYVSTYPTMMGLIEETTDGQRKFGVGHFDLIVIDEAHRSVFQKYRAIFDYFDGLLVGLTATPKDEVGRNTYRLFDLEDGVPTDAYGLEDAVKDGFLVPPKAVSVPLKFQREGIAYDDLSEEEKEQWDELEWSEEEGTPPDRVGAEAINKWLFNKDTVDKVLENVMTNGLKVAGGDRLGKTIIFAKSQAHAEFIADRFNANYPHYKGQFARVITFETKYAQSLIDDFSAKDKAPHIAISVDMLDTGIDVPEVVNLVFFKVVRSKTKFWQMLGRGTRLCPNLFGPGKHKDCFYVFDYCQNLEFFRENPEATDGAAGATLSTKLFRSRLELVGALDERRQGRIQESEDSEIELRRDVVTVLREEIGAMNLDNFVVRPKRRIIEKYRMDTAWAELDTDARRELGQEVAGLPSELAAEDEEAKRFDLLILYLQLAVLRSEPAFERLRDQVKLLAGLLEEQSSIPMIRAEMTLILELQGTEWWEGVTPAMLETVRRRLRGLMKLIEKSRRKPVYSDFEDEIGEGATIELPGFSAPHSFERFREKAQAFLREHQDHIAIQKLRTNEPLTPTDLQELERMLSESGVAEPGDLEKAKMQSEGSLGLYVRSLVGLDREAAKKALGGFASGQNLSAAQIEFVNLIVDQLTERGVMSAELLYESPFTDINPQGPEGVFAPAQVDDLLQLLAEVRKRAA